LEIGWPKQYLSGKVQLERNLEREKLIAEAAKSSMTFEEIQAKFG